MKIIFCLIAALALFGAGCAHPTVGGSQADTLESESPLAMEAPRMAPAQDMAVRDYREVLADPGPF